MPLLKMGRGVWNHAPLAGSVLLTAFIVNLATSSLSARPTTTTQGVVSDKTVHDAASESDSGTSEDGDKQRVTLIADGEVRTVATNAKTVGELLVEQNARLGQRDRCSVPLDTRIKDGLPIRVVRIRAEMVQEKTPIRYPVQMRYSFDRAAAPRTVVKAGQKGSVIRKVAVVYKDGECVQRKQLAQTIIPPTTQVELLGIHNLPLTTRHGGLLRQRIVEMVATGYSPNEGSIGGGSRTATGRRATHGIVAVDPRFIRLGTRVWVEGYGPAIAADTGGAIKGNRIDLCYDSAREANSKGRRRVRVLILE